MILGNRGGPDSMSEKNKRLAPSLEAGYTSGLRMAVHIDKGPDLRCGERVRGFGEPSATDWTAKGKTTTIVGQWR